MVMHINFRIFGENGKDVDLSLTHKIFFTVHRTVDLAILLENFPKSIIRGVYKVLSIIANHCKTKIPSHRWVKF